MRGLFALVLAWTLSTWAAAQEDVRPILLGDEARRPAILLVDRSRYTPLVVAALKDADPQVRASAAVALREMDAPGEQVREREDPVGERLRPSAVSALAQAAHDPVPNVRQEAMFSLLTVLRVREWGHHGDPWIVRDQMKPLVEIGEPIVPTLLATLKSGSAPHGMRVAAARALGGIKSPRTRDGLLETMDRVDGFLLSEVMNAAIAYDDTRVVAKIIDNIAKTILSYEDSPGIWALRRLKGKAVPELVRQLPTHPKAEVRAMIAHTLSHNVDPRATAALIGALMDADAAVRSAAANALGRYSAPAVADALLRAVEDPSPEVRASAVASLCRLRVAKAFDAVARALRDPEEEVRIAAIQLASIDGKRAVPLLLPFLNDPKQRYPAVVALRPVKDRRAIPGLIDVVKSGDRYGADEAAMALAEMDARETIPILIEVMSRENPPYGMEKALFAFGKAAAEPLLAFYPRAGNARRSVIEALGGSGDSRAVDLLLPLVTDEELGLSAMEALGHLGDSRAVNPLIARLSDPVDIHASIAAEALGRLKAKAAVPALLKAMAREEVRWRAAGTLAQIADPRALDALLAFLAQRTEGRWMTLEAMSNFRDPRVLPILVAELEQDWPSSAAAARALGDLGDPAAISALRRATESDDESLQQDAKTALEKLIRKPKRLP
jgi:HEAT repeat protein